VQIKVDWRNTMAEERTKNRVTLNPISAMRMRAGQMRDRE